MKKIIALLLALIMTFSVATVAFATDETVTPPATEETTPEAPAEGEDSIADSLKEMLGEEYSWILDLPFETVKPALKIVKIAIKFVLVYVKICRAFNLDPTETAQKIFEFLGGLVEEYKPEEAPEATPEAAPAA